MERKEFLQTLLAFSVMGTLSSFQKFTDKLPTQSKKMPVLFTSHGNPMDIPLSKEQQPFWNTLFELGKDLQNNFEVKAALIVSAHWCTKGTYINISPEQKQIYDYYGFPDEYYKVYYHAKGSPGIAHEVKKIVVLITKFQLRDAAPGALAPTQKILSMSVKPFFSKKFRAEGYFQSSGRST